MATRRSYGPHDVRPGRRLVKYASKVLLDFSPALPRLHSVTLAGALQVATTNLAEGRTARLRIVGDGSARALTFPAGWVFVGRPTPTELAANEEALLVLHSCGSTDADVLVEYWASDDTDAVAVPAGADTQVQFNDAGAFGGDADLTWNKTANRLGVGSAHGADYNVEVRVDQAAATTALRLQNRNATGFCHLILQNGASDSDAAYYYVSGTGFTPLGLTLADQALFSADTGLAGGMAIGAQAGAVVMYAGNPELAASERIRINSTEIVLNDGSQAVTTRIESNGNASMVHVDGTNDRVGVGIAPAASTTLHVGATAATQLRVSSTTASSYSNLNFREGTTDRGYVQAINSTFADTTRRNALEVHSSAGPVDHYTNGVLRARTTKDGDLIVYDDTKGLVLQSPDGDFWRLTVDNAGAPTWTNLGATEPT